MKFSELFPPAKMVSSFLHPEKGYQKAYEQYQQGLNQAQGYLSPYQEQGQSIYPQYSEAIQKMLNPAALEAEWMQGYEQSPSAQYAIEDALYHGKNALSATGLGGSSPAIRAMQEGASRIGEQDRLNYLNRLGNMYFQGAGQAANLYGSGLTAAGQMGQNALTGNSQLAEALYGKTNSPGNLFGSILGSLIGGVSGTTNNLGQDPYLNGGGGSSMGGRMSQTAGNPYSYNNPGMLPWMGG